MGAEVFNSFDVDIYLSTLKSVTKTFNSNFTINNTGNCERLPIIEITTPDSLTLNSITNNSQQIIFSGINLSSTDNLVLNFKEQVYEKNGSSIISSITSIDMISLEYNIENNFSFDYSGNIEINITYESYEGTAREKYLESFKIFSNNSYEEIKPFNSNHKVDRKRTEIDYTFQMSKLPVDWELINDIENGKRFRIKYYEHNDYTYKSSTRYLTDAVFTSWDRGFGSQGSLIIDNVNGNALRLLD